MKSLSILYTAAIVHVFPNIASTLPADGPSNVTPFSEPRFFPATKPGEPLVEGSVCASNSTCPNGTTCKTTIYHSIPHCFHPDRQDHWKEPYNCRIDRDCPLDRFCDGFGNSGGYCSGFPCGCGFYDMLCYLGLTQAKCIAYWQKKRGSDI
jgi:hypothetical protein